MKKVIILIVVVVVVVILIKTLYIEFPSSKKQTSNEDNDVAKSWYEISEERFTLEKVLGVSLSETAINKHGYGTFIATVGKEANKIFWIVATLPKEDFHTLVGKLNLQKTPDLLKFWPDVFSCQEENFTKKYWDAKNSVNNETYYGEDPEYRAQTALKYENGKMYAKKEVIYIEAGTNERGSTVYKKSRRTKK
jgi:hypothetical protein